MTGWSQAALSAARVDERSGHYALATDGTLVRLVTDDRQTLNFDYHRVRPAKPPKPEDVFDLASLS